MSAEIVGEVRKNWRARLREIGKEAFIREEMERLGFWPPDEATAEKSAEAEAQLREVYHELSRLRSDLKKVETELATAQDVEKILLEIRKRRIERVRKAREAKKQQQAQQQAEKRQQDKEWRQKSLPFLGQGVSAGLRYEGGDPANVESLGLPALATASDLAGAIGITGPELAWLTYHRGAATIDHYSRFTIPKRAGGTRVISSPKKRLRVAQKWLLDSLLVRLPIHDAAMAFRPQRSIVENAEAHKGNAILIRLDLKDFFPSISFRRVKGMFQGFGYNEGIASLCALLATEAPRVAATLDGEKRFVAVGERQLPQGACTSPAITNILCRKLDARLTGAAKLHGFAYTRYADDLVFSHPNAEAEVGMLFALVRKIIAEEGYTINEEKTRVMRPQHRQVVTGLVVNTTPRLSRRDLRRFRAFLHQCETQGFDEMSKRLGKNALAYASGYLSFIHMVSPEQEEKVRRDHPWLSRWEKS